MAYSVGHIFSLIKLPRVIGEITAGIILGNSCLGAFYPELYSWVFDDFIGQKKVLSVFYWLGLVLLMFTAGLSISWKVEKADFSKIAILTMGGIIIPTIFGFLTAPLYQSNGQNSGPLFPLIIGIGTAVTSIPVLSRILIELKIIDIKFSKLVLTTAAIQDIFLWALLSVALSVEAHPESSETFQIVSLQLLGVLVFSCVSYIILPVLLRFFARIFHAHIQIESYTGYALFICLALVLLANLLQVNVVFGALLAGVIIGRLNSPPLDLVKNNISSISIWFFVPIYFVLVGMDVNLQAHFNLKILLTFLIISSLTKILSVAIFAIIGGISKSYCFDFGVVMNARGGPGIVLASLAYTSKIINEDMFVVLILSSILSSLISGFWLKVRRLKLIGFE
jgi:Kef-type K+ transport system membrane component KefB